MPNKVIKESIWSSPNLNALSDLAERHFYRLLLFSDDWGCFEASPEIIKGICYPLKKKITTTKVEQWQHELISNNLIRLWDYNSRVYGQFVTFDKHNDLKQHHRPTTPCPPWMLNDKGQDLRLASDTLDSYERISQAINRLYSSNIEPTFKIICSEAKCSMSTLTKYFKYVSATGRYTSLRNTTLPLPITTNEPCSNTVAKEIETATGVLQDTMATTHKTPNPNPNPNPNPYLEPGVVNEKNSKENEMTKKGVNQTKSKDTTPRLSSNPFMAKLQSYVGFPETIQVDPICNYDEEAGMLRIMRNKGISDEDIFQCWKDKVDVNNNNYIPLSWINREIFNWLKNGKKLPIYKNNGSKPDNMKISQEHINEDIESIRELQEMNRNG